MAVARTFSYGIDELDELLGRIEPGTMLVIEGRPGTGKTSFALSMMCKNALMHGYKTLYITLIETPEKIIRKARNIGCSIEDAVGKGLIEILKPPLIADKELTNLISKLIIEEGFGRGFDLVVVDNITTPLGLLETYAEQRAWIQTVFYDLVSRNRGVLVFIAEVFEPKSTSLFLAEYVADIVIELKYELEPMGTYERKILVKKHRFRPINTASIPFDIGSRGPIILNHIAKEKREKLLMKRKPVRIHCKPLKEIIGDKIEPGASIFVLNNKPGHVPLSKYTLAEILKREISEGYNIGFVTYGKDIAEYIASYLKKQRGISSKYSSKYKIVALDPTLVSPSAINKVIYELIVYEGVDLLLKSGIERIINITGIKLLKPYIAYSMKLQKLAGVTTIRFYNLYDPSKIPLQYLAWSDIVIIIDIDKEGRIFYQIRRTGKETVKIYNEDLLKCIES